MQLYILFENIAVFAGLSAEIQENGFINYVTFLPMQPSVFVHCVHVSPAQMKVQTDWIARKNIVRAAKTPIVLFSAHSPRIYIIYNKEPVLPIWKDGFLRELRLVDNAGKERQAVLAFDDEEEGTVQSKVHFVLWRHTGAASSNHGKGGGGDTFFVDHHPGGVVNAAHITTVILGKNGSEVRNAALKNFLHTQLLQDAHDIPLGNYIKLGQTQIDFDPLLIFLFGISKKCYHLVGDLLR